MGFFFFFKKKICNGKIKICSVDAETKMSMVRFPNGLQNCCINHDNDVAEKLKEMTDSNQNIIELEKKHLNKQMV